MPTIDISLKSLKRIPYPSGKARIYFWDVTVKGFGLQVTADGPLTYVLQYRLGGRGTPTRRYTIGRHGSPFTPDMARRRALDLLKLVSEGIDPLDVDRSETEQSEAQEKARAHFAFSSFANRFIDHHVIANKLRSRRDIEGTFDRDLRPWFGEMSVLEVTKDDIKAMLRLVGARSQPAANKAFKWLSRMYTWGIQHDRLELSPLFGLKKPFKEGKRDRTLSASEVKSLCSVMDQISWQFAVLILLLLLTGQRLREVAGIKWEDVDFDKDEWILGGARTKNKRPHLVPISRQVKRILLAIAPPEASRRGLILTTTGVTPVSGFSKVKISIDLLIGRSVPSVVMQPWVLHDLRRTFATGCSELRVPITHSEAALNHVSGSLGGVAGVYHLYKFLREKRLALQKWADHVERLVGRPVEQLLPARDRQVLP